MAKDAHVSDSELMRFLDCETGAGDASRLEAHLESCATCRARRTELQSASQAYEQFHNRVLKPALARPEREWPRLQLPVQDSMPGNGFFRNPTLWWVSGLAAACLAIAAIYFGGESQQQNMTRLLARAADAPLVPHRRIVLSVAGRSWSRPAVLRSRTEAAGLEHVEALFVKANYSWEDPLSARSFAAWRSRLREKHDRVTSVAVAGGSKTLYRVRTETRDGTLRMASLTLRIDNLAAIDGDFEFENRERVSMADTGEDVREAAPASRNSAAGQKNKTPQTVEHQISAADKLRVFAALDEIGADAGEPLNVAPDAAKQHVIITGMGISKAREQQIREALADIPNAVVRFSSAHAPPAGGQNAAVPDVYPADANAQLRNLLEQRAGGAVQLQTITDRALEASNSLVAHAHALQVLAQNFPPEVEASFPDIDRSTLRRLRRRHAIAIEETTLGLAGAVKPLLAEPGTSVDDSQETGGEPNASWQAEAAKLFDEVRGLDQSVTNLLGANDSFEAGQETLTRLPKDLAQVEELAGREARTE